MENLSGLKNKFNLGRNDTVELIEEDRKPEVGRKPEQKRYYNKRPKFYEQGSIKLPILAKERVRS